MHLLRTSLSVIAASMLGLLLASCASVNSGTNRLTAECPKEEAFRKELKRDLSTLNVTVEMSSTELSDTLNRVMPPQLYKGGTSTSGLSATVSKKGPVSVSAADNHFYLTIPISLTLSYGMFQIPAVGTSLRFTVSPKVNPEWRLDPDVHYVGLTESLAEEVRIGPLAIKVRAIVDGMMQPLQRTLSELVGRKLNEKLSLKLQVAKAWSEAQKPILLDKKYHAWLVMTPRDVVLYPIHAQNNKVTISMGLTSFAEVVVGPEPPSRPPVPLPRLKAGAAADRTFRVALNTDLFYKDVLDVVSPLLLNKELGQDGRSVIIKDLDIYGNGERLMVKVETTGSVDGIFYLTCRPVFSPDTRIISVQDLDFDIQSRNLLLRSADWFLHGTFRKAIQDKLNVDLTRQLAQAREMAGNSIRRVQLADNLFLSATLKEMRLNDLMVRKDRISLGVYLEGESVVVLH